MADEARGSQHDDERRGDGRAERDRSGEGRAQKGRGERDRSGREGEGAEERPGQSPWTYIVPVAILGTLAGLYFLLPSLRHIVDKLARLLWQRDEEGLRTWMQGLGIWGPVSVVVLMIVQTIVAIIPAPLIMAVAVLAFGPWWGGLSSWIGLMLAASLAYGIGLWLGRLTVDRLVGADSEERIAAYVDRYGLWTVLAVRISPALSSDVISYVGGLVKMPYWKFAGATAAGTLPLVGVIAYLGQSFVALEQGLLWISVGTTVVFVALAVWDRVRNGPPKRRHERGGGKGEGKKEGAS